MNSESKEFISSLLERRAWGLIDTIIKSINVDLCKSDTLTAYVFTCFPYRKYLPNYRLFVKKVQISFTERGFNG